MMKHLIALTTALCLLSTAYVQSYRDDFSFGNFAPNLRWTWTLPNNNPFCTLDPTAVSFSSEEGTLQIQMRDGGMFSGFNVHRDVPSLIVQGTAPADWYIETRFRTDWTNIGVFNYVQAGIVIATGADNYFQLLITRDAFNQTNNVYGSTNLEENDNFEWGERVSNSWLPTPADEWIGLKIVHNSSVPQIELYYSSSNTGGNWVLFDGFNGGIYPEGSRQYNWIQNLISQAGTVRVGVYTDNAGSGQTDTFEFDYFETNLPVQTRASAGDVNGDGCVDDADLLAVLFGFGNSGTCLDEDVNGDGIVDDADLLTVLFEFGTGC
ncbi:MAG: hypothetical protein SNJ72_01460 [Fimbriimonadales bacterium]